MTIYELTRSSKGDGELALTFKGVLLYLVPLLVALFQVLDVQIAETDIILFIEQFTLVVASIMTLLGLARKLYYRMR